MTRRNLLQTPGAVAKIRPHRFHPNPETAASNAFQRKAAGRAPSDRIQKC